MSRANNDFPIPSAKGLRIDMSASAYNAQFEHALTMGRASAEKKHRAKLREFCAWVRATFNGNEVEMQMRDRGLWVDPEAK